MGAKKKTNKTAKWPQTILVAILLLVIAVLRLGFRKSEEPKTPAKLPTVNREGALPQKFDVDYGLPRFEKGSPIVRHSAYTLLYDEEHEQPRWVAYSLKSEYFQAGSPKEKRTDDFRPDPAVKTASAQLNDYRRSGYDRGHLVPAADMKWSKKAMSETFLLSNISPQNHAFNEGIWADLEHEVRGWATENGQIFIVTGPLLTGNMRTIGPNKVSVPPAFYKVVLDASEPELKAIGFIIPNEPGKKTFWDYAITVDDVERQTGIDFFPALPDSEENRLESQVDPRLWYQN